MVKIISYIEILNSESIEKFPDSLTKKIWPEFWALSFTYIYTLKMKDIFLNSKLVCLTLISAFSKLVINIKNGRNNVDKSIFGLRRFA
jgi:hypothetical protein